MDTKTQFLVQVDQGEFFSSCASGDQMASLFQAAIAQVLGSAKVYPLFPQNGQEANQIFTASEPYVDMNGKREYLGVRCVHCNVWIAGAHNYHHCPKCGTMVTHVVDDPAKDE
jgi:hypothetical protein